MLIPFHLRRSPSDEKCRIPPRHILGDPEHLWVVTESSTRLKYPISLPLRILANGTQDNQNLMGGAVVSKWNIRPADDDLAVYVC